MIQCNVHPRNGIHGENTGQYMCFTCGALQEFPIDLNIAVTTKLGNCQYPEQVPEPGHMAEDKSWVEKLVPEPTGRERQLSAMLEDYKTVVHAFASILHKMSTEYNKDDCCDYVVINRLIEESEALTAAFRLRNY